MYYLNELSKHYFSFIQSYILTITCECFQLKRKCYNDQDNKKIMVPVQSPPGFNSHPVNSKIHLPYKRRHADSHSVSCTENYTWLLTHDPTGGSTITDNMTLLSTDVDLFFDFL